MKAGRVESKQGQLQPRFHHQTSVWYARCYSDMCILTFWASPFPNPSDMGIPFSYNLSGRTNTPGSKPN